MHTIVEIIDCINENILWGIPMLVMMFGTGMRIILATGGSLFLHPVFVMRNIKELLFSEESKTKEQGRKEGITPFQAVATALAGTLGTGNIVGVALAVSIGGPGSIFWMWAAALFGMVIKYSEVALAVNYREKKKSGNTGGPMYYMQKGLNKRWMAVWFCIATIISSFGIGSSVQSNSLAQSAKAAFGINECVTAAVVSVLSALVLIGGIRRISNMAQVLVPAMAGLYIFAALIVLAANFKEIPQAFVTIIHDAFKGSAAIGGFAGATVMQACRLGLSRGVFTNEAGLGSAPIAHAAGNVKYPAQQGILGAFEVFVDTIVMCTLTALVMLVTGAWKENAGMDTVAAAFDSVIPFGIGGYVVMLGLILFAFATIPAWYYYGERCVEFLFGNAMILPYKILYVAFVYVGAVINIGHVWKFADFSNAMMAVPNLVALLMLAPQVRKITQEYFLDL